MGQGWDGEGVEQGVGGAADSPPVYTDVFTDVYIGLYDMVAAAHTLALGSRLPEGSAWKVAPLASLTVPVAAMATPCGSRVWASGLRIRDSSSASAQHGHTPCGAGGRRDGAVA